MKSAHTGLDVTLRELNHLTNKLRHPEPLLHQIAQLLCNSTVERFHTATDSEGKAWERLKPATILRKGHDKRLVDTGKLMGSITFSVKQSKISVYSTDNPGKVHGHQHGNQSKNLPKRAIFGISRRDAEDIQNLISNWMGYE